MITEKHDPVRPKHRSLVTVQIQILEIVSAIIIASRAVKKVISGKVHFRTQCLSFFTIEVPYSFKVCHTKGKERTAGVSKLGGRQDTLPFF